MLRLQNVTVIYSGTAAERTTVSAASTMRGSPPAGTKAIDSVSFTLNESENIALIGENGAGKTTLLLAIVGILEPANGTIEMDDIMLNKKTAAEFRKQIGFVFQNPDDQLFMPLVYDDIAFGCRNFGLPEQQVTARVEETLSQLNIAHLKNRSSLKISCGEKRLAAIAAVLAMNPSALMFDEPTAFLDPKARRTLVETLNNLRHAKIIATHDMDFAAQVCSRVIVLKDGRIMADGDLSLLHDKELMQNCGL